MASPLSHLFNPLEIYFGMDDNGHDIPEPEPTVVKPEMPPPFGQPAADPEPSVNDLGIDDIEEFLERVEARKTSCGDPTTSGNGFDFRPTSPYYGRTTPVMFSGDLAACPASSSLPNDVTMMSLPPLDVATVAIRGLRTGSIGDQSGIVPDFSLLDEESIPIETVEESSAMALDELKPEPLASHAESLASKSEPVASHSESVQVKTELKEKIKKRRRESGKAAIVIDWTAETANNKDSELSPRDVERRLRRRESNRRAAQKSRVKKRQQNDNFMKEMEDLTQENKELKDEVEVLRRQVRGLTSSFHEHMKVCPNPSSLLASLNDER